MYCSHYDIHNNIIIVLMVHIFVLWLEIFKYTLSPVIKEDTVLGNIISK